MDVTGKNIEAAIVALGIESGDMVLVHSSMKSFGHVVGGPEAVIDSFLKILGKEGTLVMPTLSQQNWETVYEDWGMDRPSDVGLLTEVFRKRDDAHRSNQATHSVAAVGRMAAQLTQGHTAFGPRIGPFGDYAFSHSSPWEKLYDKNATIVFLGVSMVYNTIKHLAEHRFMERMLESVKNSAWYEAARNEVKRYGCCPEEGVWPYLDGAQLQAAYEAAGLVRRTRCGGAELLCIAAKPCVEFTEHLLEENPEQWLDAGTYAWLKKIKRIEKE